MISAIENLWPRISFVLLLALISSFLFWPAKLAWLGPALITLSMAVVTASMVKRRIQSYRAGKLDRASLALQIALDLAGLLLPVGAAMLAGRAAGAAMNALWGPVAGLLSAFAAAFLAGFATGLAWRRLALPRLTGP